MARWSPRQAAAPLERLLWYVAAICLLVIATRGVEVRAARQSAAAIPATPPAAVQDQQDDAAIARPWVDAKDNTVVGRLEIPDLKLSVPVLSNFDPDSLKRGVGHIEGTALPGGLGTLGLAGHRDTFFRPLRHIAKNMDIRITDAAGTFHYIVDSTEIVTPDEVQVLDILNQPKLTLITCYPFDFIGQAPKRFIVHAHLLSLEPDTPSATAATHRQ